MPRSELISSIMCTGMRMVRADLPSLGSWLTESSLLNWGAGVSSWSGGRPWQDVS